MRGAWNNILLIWICTTLQPLRPVNLSDSSISLETAAIYLIFSLELTHDFIVPVLAELQQSLQSFSDLVILLFETVNTCTLSFYCDALAFLQGRFYLPIKIKGTISQPVWLHTHEKVFTDRHAVWVNKNNLGIDLENYQTCM